MILILVFRPSSAVNIKRQNEGNYHHVNSSGLLERKSSSNSVLALNQSSVRNVGESTKKTNVLFNKSGNNQLANSTNFSGIGGKAYRPLQNSLNASEMAEMTKNLISNKDGYNTTRLISTAEKKTLKHGGQMSNNYLTNNGQSRQNVFVLLNRILLIYQLKLAMKIMLRDPTLLLINTSTDQTQI